MRLKSNFDLHSFLTWKAMWYWLWYWLWYLENLQPLQLLPRWDFVSGGLSDAFHGQESAMKEAHPADPCSRLSSGATVLGPLVHSSSSAG